MFVDTHCHLAMKEYAGDRDRDDVTDSRSKVVIV